MARTLPIDFNQLCLKNTTNMKISDDFSESSNISEVEQNVCQFSLKQLYQNNVLTDTLFTFEWADLFTKTDNDFLCAIHNVGEECKLPSEKRKKEFLYSIEKNKFLMSSEEARHCIQRFVFDENTFIGNTKLILFLETRLKQYWNLLLTFQESEIDYLGIPQFVRKELLKYLDIAEIPPTQVSFKDCVTYGTPLCKCLCFTQRQNITVMALKVLHFILTSSNKICQSIMEGLYVEDIDERNESNYASSKFNQRNDFRTFEDRSGNHKLRKTNFVSDVAKEKKNDDEDLFGEDDEMDIILTQMKFNEDTNKQESKNDKERKNLKVEHPKDASEEINFRMMRSLSKSNLFDLLVRIWRLATYPNNKFELFCNAMKCTLVLMDNSPLKTKLYMSKLDMESFKYFHQLTLQPIPTEIPYYLFKFLSNYGREQANLEFIRRCESGKIRYQDECQEEPAFTIYCRLIKNIHKHVVESEEEIYFVTLEELMKFLYLILSENGIESVHTKSCNCWFEFFVGLINMLYDLRKRQKTSWLLKMIYTTKVAAYLSRWMYDKNPYSAKLHYVLSYLQANTKFDEVNMCLEQARKEYYIRNDIDDDE